MEQLGSSKGNPVRNSVTKKRGKQETLYIGRQVEYINEYKCFHLHKYRVIYNDIIGRDSSDEDDDKDESHDSDDKSTDDEDQEETAEKDDDDEDDFHLTEGSIDESREDEVMAAQFEKPKGKKYVPKKADKSRIFGDNIHG